MLLVATALILSTGAVAGQGYPAHDQAGNPYPVECQRDLSGVDIVVIGKDTESIKALAAHHGFDAHMRTLAFVVFTMPRPTVFVDNTLPLGKIIDAIHHERCHVIMMHLTGNAHWH
jgi:hypothetical protein